MSPASRIPPFALTLVLTIVGGCANGETSEGSPVATSAVITTTTAVAASATTATVPVTTAPAPSTTTLVQPDGFVLEPAEVTLVDGEVCQLCMWVAETSAQRQRGLMGVTDLGGADGMVFVYDGPASGQFWMRGTPMPLSIAFFAADGSFVSASDMEPCLTGPAAACPRYAAAAPYVAAIEVPQGGLAELGIGPGSRLALARGPGCDDLGP